MAVTLFGTLDSAQLPRIEATNQGQSVEFADLGGTDLDSQTNLQRNAGNGFQFLNNVIAVWAASTGQDARSSIVQIIAMLQDMIQRPEVAATYYEP